MSDAAFAAEAPWRPGASWISAGFGLAAAAAPVLTAGLMQLVRSAARETPAGWASLSIGIPTAMMVCTLIGLRFGRLSQLVLGPVIGGAVGYFDLSSLGCLVRAGLPVQWAGLAPIWGLGLGLWAGSSRRSLGKVITVAVVVAVVDLAARVLWIGLLAIPPVSDWYFEANYDVLVGSATYSPPALVAVLAVRRNEVGSSLPECGDRV